ncbi:hypothetical protein Tco_0925266 [Tanacetum coccineum]|uniref:Uncharacterized protein n=1 Tax=Tanacetum coccineum TaxID=301880 RepID=A0ABQ5D900_9ASTR
MDASKRITIPMQPNVDWSSMMYAVRCTRLDVAFSYNLTSRYQQMPGESHWTAVKNILKYLRNTKDMFLVYGGDSTTELSVTCYTDASWAEYIAASEAAMEAIWIHKFISRLGVVPDNDRPMDMYCDNTGAITIADEPCVQKGAKHFRRKYHFIREVIQEVGAVGVISIDHLVSRVGSCEEGLYCFLPITLQRSSYARAMIELQADVELKDTIVVAMPKLVREGLYTCTIRIEYEWKPPSQAPRGVPVGPKVGFKPVKQVYRPVSKRNNANTSGNKKKMRSTNGGTSNLASKEANSSGYSFWNVRSNSTSTTPIVENFDKLKKLIIDGKITLVDDEVKPLEKVDYAGDHDSKDEVESVNNEMASFLASKRIGYDTNSLLEQ